MFGRGRVRAPVSLLIATLLGLGLAGAAQSPALALQPAAAPLSRAAQPATAAAAAAAPATVHAAAPDAVGPDHRSGPPKEPLPQKFAQQKARYAPAGCNTTAPAKHTVRCFAEVRTDAEHRVLASASGPAPSALTPADIKAAYGLPDGGQGQTVAIVDAFGYSSFESDLATFRSQFGLPACTTASGCLRKADQRGGSDYPADDAEWGEETALDLDAVSSACPQCHILLVEADSTSSDDLGAAVRTAVALGAKFVSNSYGISGESPLETALTDYDQPGVVITASTGDLGNVVNWPASDPDVVAVGGTTLTRDASTSRGWTESAWSGGGSGCSLYEPQPDYQADLATDCPRKATADISADADPATGLAVYDTLGKGGWLQVGGTSLSSPLVASMYALAGTPAPGTLPVTYPYADQGNHLFDVTGGSDGSCGGVLCEAGAGWDGPTGLGTPNGVSALTMGPHGTVKGKITESSSGAPVAGAGVVLTDPADKLSYRAKTGTDGTFDVAVSAGTYTAKVTAYGYGTGTLDALAVAAGGTATADVSLDKVPSALLSGKVTDASGHGWPLYAKITIDGYPNGAIYTDPRTGAYHVDLPDQADYTLHVAPVYPGYGTSDSTVHLGTAATTHDVPLGADRTACVAPGYAYPGQADFEGWTTSAQAGWSVTGGGSGPGWEFDDPFQQANFTGGAGNFATADPFDNGGPAENTDLASPVLDLSAQPTAHLQFDAAYIAADGTHAGADLSTDGGKTWSQVWQATAPEFQGHVDVPLDKALAAGDPDNVKVRFHYDGSGLSLFQLDTVTVGSCSLVAGGLVEGTVTDANTHRPVDGATVTDRDDPSATTASVATPDDTVLGDGFYWLFSPGAGKHTYTAAAPRYTTATHQAATSGTAVTAQNIVLQAGRLKVSPAHATFKEELGKKGSTSVTLTNTGGAPLHVSVGEQSAPVGPAAASSRAASGGSSAGAPLQHVKGTFTTGPVTAPAPGTPARARKAPAAAAPPAAAPWQRLTDYPEPVMDNASATYEGRTYSVGGIAQVVGGSGLTDGYVYDPATRVWSAIAPLPLSLEAPVAAFVGGTMYVAGGWHGPAEDIRTQATVYAYHPASDTWTRVADLPQGLATASTAVYDGKLYVVGGTTNDGSVLSSAVYRYDPARNTWSRAADYPTTVQWGACGATGTGLVCAGGATRNTTGNTVGLSSTYVYDATADTWTRVADAPYTVWGAASSAGGGELQLVGGIIGDEGTNSAIQYDPVANTWSALPNPAFAVFRTGGSGCGLSQIGGALAGGFFPTGGPQAETLPGYGECGGEDVGWLSENKAGADIAPGRSVTLRVTADTGALAAPGDYAATLSLTTDAPYATAPVAVTAKVTAPATWSEIGGQVTDAATKAPVAGATVTVCGDARSACAHPLATVGTDREGRYDLWLKSGSGRLAVTAAADGYASGTGEVTTARGSRSTLGLSLRAAS